MTRFAWILVATCLVGCSGGDSADTGSSVSPPGPTFTTADAEMCSAACATVASCPMSQTLPTPLDATRCQAGCKEQLLGNGWLDLTVGRAYYKRLQTLGTDPTCIAWKGEIGFYNEAELIPTPPTSHSKCIELFTQTCPATSDTAKADVFHGCFSNYFRYKESHRLKYEACLAKKPCADMGACLFQVYAEAPTETGEAPWLGLAAK